MNSVEILLQALDKFLAPVVVGLCDKVLGLVGIACHVSGFSGRGR